MTTSALQCVWDGHADLGEGVFWHAQEQAVYWVDILQSKLHRLNPDQTVDSWHFPGQLSAVVPCIEGGLLATFENGLHHIDLKSETVTLLHALETELADNRFNDGCSDTRGQLWFGSMDNKQRDKSGSFYRMDARGHIERQAAFGQFCITNGPAFSADGNWIYFNDSVERRVYRAPLNDRGEAGQPELHIELTEEDGHPDGMCTDSDGGLWVCHFAGGRVTRFVDGVVDDVIDMPVPNITKCAFGGIDLNTLYITTAATGLDEQQRQAFPLAGGLFAISLPFQGVPMTPVARCEQLTQ